MEHEAAFGAILIEARSGKPRLVATVVSMKILSRVVMPSLVLVATFTIVSGSDRRLGSPIGGQSPIAHEESSLFWDRLLQTTYSSMPLTPSAAPTSKTVYLAIGDSLCTGQLPEPKNQALYSDKGYTDNLFDYLKTSQGIDTLNKICCPGEDSHELINGTYNQPPSDGSKCYGKVDELPNQLEAAIQAMQSDSVEFITISVGANDVFGCLETSDPVACGSRRIAELVANLATIVATILEALGSNVPPIIAMTPYNPILAYSLSDNAAEQALVPISQQVITELHTATTENVYEPFGIPVVDALIVFDGLNDTLVDGVPQSVVSICEYTGMCRKTESGDYVLNDSLVRDIHPTEGGYERLAKAHNEIVEQFELR